MYDPERKGRFAYVDTVHYENKDGDGALCGRFSVMAWTNRAGISPVTCKACLKMTTPKTNDPLKPSLALLCKLASITVHADELTSTQGHTVDQFALRSVVEDSEVKEWIKSMGPFVPVKR